jgi:glucose-6-phosphate isomerase
MPRETRFPFTFNIVPSLTSILDQYDNHIIRNLSAMEGQYQDLAAYEAKLAKSDPILYEVYEVSRPQVAGELLMGISIVHPGKVGNEYFMTKGHFHTVLDTSEMYYCLRGEGFMVMETPEGAWEVEALKPGMVLYVPPRWAHRSVNSGTQEDLITFFVYPGNAGHDYGSIERQGFRKLILDSKGTPEIVDNPQWMPPEGR